MKINDALVNLATDPDYAEYNFILANCYENEKQYASAISFYLRSAELAHNKLLSYESLLRIYMCFMSLQNRLTIAEGLLLRAISILPLRAEAYFLISRHYEIIKHWHQSYNYACIGEKIYNKKAASLRTNVEYYGKYGFKFQKAVAGWNIGLFTESISILKHLGRLGNLPDYVLLQVQHNLKYAAAHIMNTAKYGKNLEFPDYLHKGCCKYFGSMANRFRFKFAGMEDVTENYSQCYQDMFILSATQGKRNGYYLEIGCGFPKYNSNTYLLESVFGWTGIAIDINPEITHLQKKYRQSSIICQDATMLDYSKILDGYPYNMDYLQIDCEPAINSYNILQRIPLGKYRFATITFEHEHYIDENEEIRNLSRKYLESWGYRMIVNDVAMDDHASFEDWWVHPELINQDIINKMKSNAKINNVTEYFFVL